MNQFQKANHKCYGDNQNRNVKNQDNQNIHDCCGIMILGLQEVSIHIIAFAYYLIGIKSSENVFDSPKIATRISLIARLNSVNFASFLGCAFIIILTLQDDRSPIIGLLKTSKKC